MGTLSEVGALYESRPYPPVGLLSALQPVQRDNLPLLNYQAGYASCHGSLEGAAERPKILVAGCGTFEAVAVALANPRADILAVDLSARSLQKLRWQARLRGLGNRIRILQADIERLKETNFDYVIGTGFLHHLENPERVLRQLADQSASRAVFRFMVYSKWGRDLLYGAKDLAQALGVKEPKAMRKLIASLAPDHPYRIYFHLYADTTTDAGLCDGYLHPIDRPFEALALRNFLAGAGLEVGRFLHRPEGQPEFASTLGVGKEVGPWERLAVLECLGALEENFCFFASRGDPAKFRVACRYGQSLWNPALPSSGNFQSRLLGEKISFRQATPLDLLDEGQRDKLERALFLLPGASP